MRRGAGGAALTLLGSPNPAFENVGVEVSLAPSEQGEWAGTVRMDDTPASLDAAVTVMAMFGFVVYL